MTIDFSKFLAEGIESQQKYAEASNMPGPLDDLTKEAREKMVIEYIGHLIEEAVETRFLVPRRSWKTHEPSFLDNEEGTKEFCYELTDILLFFRATLAYSGISVEEFEKCFNEKLHYNTKRPDHKVNV